MAARNANLTISHNAVYYAGPCALGGDCGDADSPTGFAEGPFGFEAMAPGAFAEGPSGLGGMMPPIDTVPNSIDQTAVPDTRSTPTVPATVASPTNAAVGVRGAFIAMAVAAAAAVF